MFHDWISVERLKRAWKRVRKNKGAAGGDHQTIAQFGRELDERLLRLSEQLRSGRYRPGPLRRFDIKKPNGGTRGLAITCVRDRVAQAACAAAISVHVDGQMSDASFAYRRGRSVEHAAGLVLAYRLRGYNWVVDGDIEAYFDSIQHDPLIQMMARYVPCQKTQTVIAVWLRGFGRHGSGVAQGSPLSPLLANLYLTGVDRMIDRKEARLVRYADDFLILTRSRVEAELACSRMRMALAELGLNLHPEKTRIAQFHDGVDFLGVQFKGRLVQRN